MEIPNLPDWTEERHLRVFAGIELVAEKLHGESWKVKVSRCSGCGHCCENFNYPGTLMGLPINEDGSCGHLVRDGHKRICGLGNARPFSCSTGKGLDRYKGSTERFREV